MFLKYIGSYARKFTGYNLKVHYLKNQVLISLTTVIIYYHYKRKSREQGLITKKCVEMHKNNFLNFKMVLYSSALVMNPFNNSIKLF